MRHHQAVVGLLIIISGLQGWGKGEKKEEFEQPSPLPPLVYVLDRI